VKALDTNVLLRYFLNDEKRQSAIAANLIESCTEQNPGFINIVVLCEFIWVLKTSYGYQKSILANLLEKILQTGQLMVQESESVDVALALYRSHNIDFADALIGVINTSAGYKKTTTFDKKAAKLNEFELLK
jgi:predicted nucleic-acid-binding protein